MTKEYTHVRLEIPIYNTLKSNADNEKMSISRYIEKLLSQMLTSITTCSEIDNKRTIERVANPVFPQGTRGFKSPSRRLFF